MGVSPQHAPLRCILDPGVLNCRLKDGSTQVFAVATGLARVENDVVTVLADAAERGADIDVGRAEAAKERARQRLHSMDSHIDHTRAEAALERALARIQAARRV